MSELKDLKHRSINTKPKDSTSNLHLMGKIIYGLLRKLRIKNEILGCFFSYYIAPGIDAELKIAIRFRSDEELSNVNLKINKICEENKGIIHDSGSFNPTGGILKGFLPNEIVVDYIGCYAFEWYLNNQKVLLNACKNVNELATFFIKNRKKIDDELLNGNIYRNMKVVTPNNQELEIIRGRFVHYICNIIKISYQMEKNLENVISQNGWGIRIFLNY